MRKLQTDVACTPEAAMVLGNRTCHLAAVIPALLADAMIGRNWIDEARTLLKSALEYIPTICGCGN